MKLAARYHARGLYIKLFMRTHNSIITWHEVNGPRGFNRIRAIRWLRACMIMNYDVQVSHISMYKSKATLDCLAKCHSPTVQPTALSLTIRLSVNLSAIGSTQ